MNASPPPTPFNSPRRFIRILLKAVALLLICDVLQIAFHVASTIDHWSIYQALTPPTARLGIANQIGDPIWWRINVLLDAHKIARPKAPDEYRVIFLGDSATFCLYCKAGEAIPQVFTDQEASIDGKRVVGYNLAYPGPDWLKDILILKHALDYQPDAIVWLITANGSSDQPNPNNPDPTLFVRINADELPALARQYQFSTWETKLYAEADAWYQSSIWLHGGRYRDWLVLAARALWNALIRTKDLTTDYLLPGSPITEQPIRPIAEINSGLPGYESLPNSRWDLLLAGQRMAHEKGIPLLIVNEPLYVGSGPNSEINYNSYYERALYDRFRAALTGFTQQYQLPLLDLWNFLPPENFSNTALHYNLEGNRKIAQQVMQSLQALVR